MIKSFSDKETQKLFEAGASKRLPADLTHRAIRKLDMLDAAMRVEDLRLPPSNRLHRLRGDKDGQWSLSVNDQWRICFRFEGNDAYDVEVCDYH